MTKNILATIMIFSLVLFAGCGQDTYDNQEEKTPEVGIRFNMAKADATGCPVSQLEGSETGYAQDRLPDNISKLNFTLYDANGKLLVQTEVEVKPVCENSYTCMLPGKSAFKLFNVPTQQNMHIEVLAFNSTGNRIWEGHNFNVDVTKQSNPNVDAKPVDVYMRRVNNMTRAFNCTNSGRMFHSATLLRDGQKVLVVGGVSMGRTDACGEKVCQPDDPDCDWTEVECDLLSASKQVTIFNTESGEFEGYPEGSTALAEINSPRAGHQAVLLGDGRVLIMGGAQKLWLRHGSDGRAYVEADLDYIHRTAVIYNPSGRGRVDATVNMATPRMFFTVTPLDTDPPKATRFLLAGGWGDGGRLAGMEKMKFDPFDQDNPDTTPVFTAITTSSLVTPRTGHSATRISTGQVFFYGGAAPGEPVAEIFMDETSPTMLPTQFSNFTQWPNLYYHSAQASADRKKILITGGIQKVYQSGHEHFNDPVKSSLYIDFDGIETTIMNMVYNRAFHASALMPDGDIIVFGGVNGLQLKTGVQPFEVFSGESFQELENADGENVRMGAVKTGDLGLTRMGFSSTQLMDGSVLIIGGAMPTPAPEESFPTKKEYLRSAEIYFPVQ